MTPEQIADWTRRLPAPEVDWALWKEIAQSLLRPHLVTCALLAHAANYPPALLPIAVALVPEGMWWAVDAAPICGASLVGADDDRSSEAVAPYPAAALALAALAARENGNG